MGVSFVFFQARPALTCQTAAAILAAVFTILPVNRRPGDFDPAAVTANVILNARHTGLPSKNCLRGRSGQTI
jgi:hypothetical protein